MSTKKNHGPLLYVNQAFSRTPTNKNMQDIYISKGEQKEIEEEKPLEKEAKKKVSLIKKEIEQEITSKVEIVSDSLESPHNHKSKATFNRVKPFKEMDVKERLEYLINFPKVLPPAPCVFYTSEKNYQGYLTAYEDQQITIQFHDETTKDIPLVELKDIIMIGIKR